MLNNLYTPIAKSNTVKKPSGPIINHHDISYLIVQISKAHRTKANELLQKYGLYAGQEFILSALINEEGLTNTELADRLDVSAPTATKMIQRMEKSHLVYKEKDKKDSRMNRIYPTEEAKELASNLQNTWENLDDTTTQNLDDSEKSLLKRLLMQVLDNLSKEEK